MPLTLRKASLCARVANEGRVVASEVLRRSPMPLLHQRCMLHSPLHGFRGACILYRRFGGGCPPTRVDDGVRPALSQALPWQWTRP